MEVSIITMTEENFYILLDSSPKFLLPLILGYISIFLRVIDSIIFYKYSDDLEVLNKRVDLNNIKQIKSEFNLKKFKSIKDNKEKATITQIKKYFEKNKISKRISEKIRISKEYLDELVQELYLIKVREEGKPIIYKLTPKASREL